MNLKQIDAALAVYRAGLTDGDLARLAFFRQLWDEQAACAAAIDVSGYEVPSADRLKAWYAAAEPVFHAAPPTIDTGAFSEALARMCACAIDGGGFSPEMNAALACLKWDRVVSARSLSEAGRDPAAYLDGLFGMLVDEGMTEEEAHTATLLASLALRSQIEGASLAVMDAIAKAHTHHEVRPIDCPVCGGTAAVARVGGEGPSEGRAKSLWCFQCGASWEFERVRCARCGTQNPSHLHYFNVEGDDAHRIATCDECGGYIRTVYAEDTLAPFSFDVEDIVMARLDAIARKPSFAGGKDA